MKLADFSTPGAGEPGLRSGGRGPFTVMPDSTTSAVVLNQGEGLDGSESGVTLKVTSNCKPVGTAEPPSDVGISGRGRLGVTNAQIDGGEGNSAIAPEGERLEERKISLTSEVPRAPVSPAAERRAHVRPSSGGPRDSTPQTRAVPLALAGLPPFVGGKGPRYMPSPTCAGGPLMSCPGEGPERWPETGHRKCERSAWVDSCAWPDPATCPFRPGSSSSGRGPLQRDSARLERAGPRDEGRRE